MATYELDPAPQPTHKTTGISKTEFRQGVLSESERIRNTKAMRCVANNLSMAWLAFDLGQDAAAIGKAGTTFFDLLAESFASYSDATSLDVTNEDFIKGIQLQGHVGLLDSPQRVTEILQGVPLNAA